ncbi:MAG: cobaltochelatase subunit CobN, partial [Acidobacteriota bacterium]|nr:cobaltochelatase subunit CobN [Acidobacteriota bacterium]
MTSHTMNPQLAQAKSQDADSATERGRRVLELYDQLIEIEERLIPTGLHVFGQPSEVSERADMLRMIASFDRPEFGARALPDLVAAHLGVTASDERVAEIVSRSVKEFVASGCDAAVTLLANDAHVAVDLSRPVFELLGQVSKQLETNGETQALLRALRGEYIEAGPGADIVQN